jgi:hypothetical protein
VASGPQGAPRDLVVGVVDRQVDDDVHGLVREQRIDRGVRPAAMSLGEGGRTNRIEVRCGDQVDLGMGQDVARVSTGDVAGADDADTEGPHDRSLPDCRMVTL